MAGRMPKKSLDLVSSGRPIWAAPEGLETFGRIGGAVLLCRNSHAALPNDGRGCEFNE